ncbi:hypothetical protein F443_05257, partial [Phytophthora nicotianae P1569]
VKVILTHVNAPELHRSSNVVLQEEFSALDVSVSDIVAIFAKVEEVRDAINQLEQSKASTGHSDTLLKVLGSTLQLQQELNNKLKELMSEMKVKVTKDENNPKKRKPDEKKHEKSTSLSNFSSSWSSSSSEDDDCDGEEEVNKQEKQKLAEGSKQPKVSEFVAANGKRESADLSLAHEALSSLSNMTTDNNILQFKVMDKWAETLFKLKLILNRLSSRNANTPDKPTAEVTSRALEAAVVALRKFDWTPELAEEVRGLLAALSDACSKNETLMVYFHRVRAELESLEMNMPQAKPVTIMSTESLDVQILHFKKLVQKVQKLPRREKSKCAMEAIELMQHVMAMDHSRTHRTEVRRAAKAVKYWFCAVPFRIELGDVYESFTNKFAGYCKSLKGSKYEGDVDGMLRVLDTRRRKFKTPAKTKRKQDQLKAIIADVEQWQADTFSSSQMASAITRFSSVATYQVKEWDPLADSNSRLCVDKLIRCIHLMPQRSHRDKYLKTLNKCKKSIDTYQ